MHINYGPNDNMHTHIFCCCRVVVVGVFGWAMALAFRPATRQQYNTEIVPCAHTRVIVFTDAGCMLCGMPELSGMEKSFYIYYTLYVSAGGVRAAFHHANAPTRSETTPPKRKLHRVFFVFVVFLAVRLLLFRASPTLRVEGEV